MNQLTQQLIEAAIAARIQGPTRVAAHEARMDEIAREAATPRPPPVPAVQPRRRR